MTDFIVMLIQLKKMTHNDCLKSLMLNLIFVILFQHFFWFKLRVDITNAKYAIILCLYSTATRI